MHFFQINVGDYAVQTGHLSLLEEGILWRLRRKYYASEEPLPADKGKLARLVGARSRDELAALESVIADDFFELREDGYHDPKIDADIEAFAATEPERDLKRKNEQNRNKNHRAERSRLFKILTEAGGHAAWNIGMSELRAMVKAVAGSKPATPETLQGVDLQRPATRPATAPATPDTATQYPIPNTQYPNIQGAPVEHQQAGGLSGGPVGPARAGFEDSGSDAGSGPGSAAVLALAAEAAGAMRSAGLADVSETHPRLVALVRAGMTVAELADAARAAVAARVDKGFPWALARAEGQRRDAASVASLPDAVPSGPALDPDSVSAIKADGVRLGIGPYSCVDDRTGRTVLWAEYAARVRAARAEDAAGVAA